MNASAEQFPYVSRDSSLGNASLAPMLPLTLIVNQNVVTTGLVDSGVAINVLPYALAQELVTSMPSSFANACRTTAPRLSRE